MTTLYVKIGAAVVVAVALFFAGWHFSALSWKAKTATAEASQAAAARTAEQTAFAAEVTYERKLQTALQRYADDIKAIPVAPITRPVWMCSGPAPVRPSSVPSTPHAPGGDPGARGAQPGVGGNIRPGIESYKQRIESVVAQCRLLRDAWPP